MKVKVRMFGGLAEHAGLHEEVLDIAEGSTMKELMGIVFERHPGAAPLAERIRSALNQEMARGDEVLSEDDEVALLPPVAGGSTRILTGLREGGSAVQEALDAVSAPDAGGTVLFIGTVRNHADEWGEVDRLEYSAYREMAESVLRQVAEEASTKWPLAGIAILHGLGELTIGDHTVVVACSSAHRGEAFEAARYGIDEVKLRCPVWKKESRAGVHRWVGLDSVQPPADAEGTPASGSG
ncbi:MAG: molybdenum cofactor biosynthesis protein MoaE [Actinomycetota bacterium]